MRRINIEADLTQYYVKERMSGPEIASIIGTGVSLVYRRLREQGISVKNRRWLSVDYKKLKKLYKSGVTLHDLAKKFNCSESAIKQRIKRLGIAARKLKPGTYKHRLDSYLMREYGITREEYEKLLKKQKGKCKICRRLPAKTGRTSNRLHIDHKGKKVRGLLCANCNRGLGYLQDNPNLLRRAALYIEANR